jgi:dTDP-4-dehydrorhamnose reductase
LPADKPHQNNHISTDYIFDGVKGGYDENATRIRSAFTQGKACQRKCSCSKRSRISTIRTMIIYGYGKNVKQNFALWLINSLGRNEPVKIVDDQYGMPTMVDDLGLALLRIVERERTGVYNVCGSEYINRFDFAVKLADIFGSTKA